MLKQLFKPLIFLSILVIAASANAQAVQEKPAKEEASAEKDKKDEKKEEKKWYDFITLSAMTRVRPEIKANIGFQEGSSHQADFIAQKTWITLTASPLDYLKGVFTIQDSRLWGGENDSAAGLSTSAEKSQSLDFREAYLDLGLYQNALHILAGRQKIAFGDQRLFGALEWNNVGRSFDALRVKWDFGINSLNAWSALLTETNALDAPQISAYQDLGESYYNGVYNSTRFSDFLLADIYYASKINISDSTSLKHHTVGARITDRTDNGKTANNFPLDFTLEGAYQFGVKNSKTVSAYAGAAALGYTINGDVKIRIGAEADIASGDSNSEDTNWETFDNMYPTNHSHYGQGDVISWQNMLAFSGNVNVMFAKEFSMVLAYWYLSRLTNTDSWYAVSGGANTNQTWITDANKTVSSSEFLAHEIDLTLKSEIGKYFALEGGYSIVLPGTAPLDAGNNKPYHFVYLAGTLKF